MKLAKAIMLPARLWTLFCKLEQGIDTNDDTVRLQEATQGMMLNAAATCLPSRVIQPIEYSKYECTASI